MAKCAHSLHLRFLIDVHIWSLALSHVNEIINIGRAVEHSWLEATSETNMAKCAPISMYLIGIVYHFIRFRQHQLVHRVWTYYFLVFECRVTFMVVSVC